MVEIEGFDSVDLNEKLNAVLDKIAETLTLEIQEQARRNTPVNTGNLRSAIQWRKVQDGYEVFVDEGAAPYAKYVEFGTAAMVAAHGEHNPDRPITTWLAKTERGSANPSIMPFLRPAVKQVVARHNE